MAWEKGQSGNISGKPKDGKLWLDAVKRAIKARESTDPQALEKLADNLLKACDTGDIAALRELADRLDGKATNFIVVENRTAFDDMALDELAKRDKELTQRIERLQAINSRSSEETEVGSLPTLQ